MTGLAIKENRIVFFNSGKPLDMYAAEIDNCLGLWNIHSVLIVPIRDSLGELYGVI